MSAARFIVVLLSLEIYGYTINRKQAQIGYTASTKVYFYLAPGLLNNYPEFEVVG